MTTRSEPTICNSADSDNESLIEPVQEQSSSIINGADYGQFANSTATANHNKIIIHWENCQKSIKWNAILLKTIPKYL